VRVDVTATSVPAATANFPCAHGIGIQPDAALILSGNEQLTLVSSDPVANLVTNADPVNPHTCSIATFVYDHSIEAAGIAPTGYPTKIETITPVLTGGSVIDTVPHNLGSVPDLVLPIGTYLLPVAGMGVLSILSADATDVYVACSGNAGPLEMLLIKHHSIMAPARSIFDCSCYFAVALTVVVPWSGGPAGTRLVAHGAPWTPDYCLVSHWGKYVGAPLTYPDSVWKQDGGVLDGTNVEIYTQAGIDACVTIWSIRRHSIVTTG